MKNLIYILISFLIISCQGQANKKNTAEKKEQETVSTNVPTNNDKVLEGNKNTAEMEQESVSANVSTGNDKELEITGLWLQSEDDDSNLSISVTKSGDEYFYTLKTNKREVSDKLTISKEGENTYVTFEGIKWDEYEGDISDEIDAAYEASKKGESESNELENANDEELEIPVGISASFSDNEIVIQNYGNSMNSYTKLGECAGKYIVLTRNETVEVPAKSDSTDKEEVITSQSDKTELKNMLDSLSNWMENEIDPKILTISIGQKLTDVLKEQKLEGFDSDYFKTISSKDSIINIYTFYYSSGGSYGMVSNPVFQWKKNDGSFGALFPKIETDIYEIHKLPCEDKNLYLLRGIRGGGGNMYQEQAKVILIKNDSLILDYPAFIGKSSTLNFTEYMSSGDSYFSFDAEKNELKFTGLGENDGVELITKDSTINIKKGTDLVLKFNGDYFE